MENNERKKAGLAVVEELEEYMILKLNSINEVCCDEYDRGRISALEEALITLNMMKERLTNE